MFLIPACVALAADGLILYLHRSLLHDAAVHDAERDDDDDGGEEQQLQQHRRAIYKVGYLTLFAWIRIGVLILPLLFHSYTGTALTCQTMYLIWYALTFVLVIAHMLSLCLVVPESMEALVPEPEGALQDLHFYRRLWYTLFFSAASNLAHFVLVQHVKSSAPTRLLAYGGSTGMMGGGNSSSKPPVSMYFAIRAHPVLQDEPALVHAMNGTWLHGMSRWGHDGTTIYHSHDDYDLFVYLFVYLFCFGDWFFFAGITIG